MRRFNYQLELFTEEISSFSQNRESKKNLFTTFYKHEKIIFLIILFIISSFVSYFIGIHKGKGTTKNKDSKESLENTSLNKNIELKIEHTQNIQSNQKIVDFKKDKNGMDLIREEEKTLNNKTNLYKDIYTIQLASYKSKAYAEREAESLKKRGIETIILNKNEYVILCAGNFTSKEKAKELYNKLKKNGRYPDCFIRRL